MHDHVRRRLIVWDRLLHACGFRYLHRFSAYHSTDCLIIFLSVETLFLLYISIPLVLSIQLQRQQTLFCRKTSKIQVFFCNTISITALTITFLTQKGGNKKLGKQSHTDKSIWGHFFPSISVKISMVWVGGLTNYSLERTDEV